MLINSSFSPEQTIKSSTPSSLPSRRLLSPPPRTTAEPQELVHVIQNACLRSTDRAIASPSTFSTSLSSTITSLPSTQGSTIPSSADDPIQRETWLIAQQLIPHLFSPRTQLTEQAIAREQQRTSAYTQSCLFAPRQVGVKSDMLPHISAKYAHPPLEVLAAATSSSATTTSSNQTTESLESIQISSPNSTIATPSPIQPSSENISLSSLHTTQDTTTQQHHQQQSSHFPQSPTYSDDDPTTQRSSPSDITTFLSPKPTSLTSYNFQSSQFGAAPSFSSSSRPLAQHSLRAVLIYHLPLLVFLILCGMVLFLAICSEKYQADFEHVVAHEVALVKLQNELAQKEKKAEIIAETKAAAAAAAAAAAQHDNHEMIVGIDHHDDNPRQELLPWPDQNEIIESAHLEVLPIIRKSSPNAVNGGDS